MPEQFYGSQNENESREAESRHLELTIDEAKCLEDLLEAELGHRWKEDYEKKLKSILFKLTGERQ